MATSVGHGLAGFAVVAAIGGSRRERLAAVVLANVPDIDLVVSFVLTGDPSTLHRDWWSHSPVAALAAAAIAWAIVAAEERWRHRASPGRRATRAAFVTGVAVLTHPILDGVLTNPARAAIVGRGAPFLIEQALLVAADLLVYGTAALALIAAVRVLRSRGATAGRTSDAGSR